MKIMLTGGSGFIGRNLMEHLTRNHEVHAPLHGELELLDEAAVRNYLLRHSFDVVIHGAVRPGHRNAKDPSHQLYNNTRMFFNIARCSESFNKMIFLGSGAIYDVHHYAPKMKEDYFDKHVPSDEHGFSKYIAGKYIEKSSNIVELRLFGVFGKYEDYAIRFISNAICNTIFDLPITINRNRTFDYLYIDDLMPVIDYFIDNKGAFKCYNVTPDKAVELKTVAGHVLKISGKDLPILISRDGMGSEYSGDNSRLRGEIKGLALTPLEDSIRNLYEWYLRNRSLLDKNYLINGNLAVKQSGDGSQGI